ncbi:esterase-like activity of phytase family protein [Salinimicrobium tongyeongense]|uniref:Esterase-like activity of phytase family protein n=1 Tax=Salinimicrobium tongyeongense TaxID=2809707 RepID=A0ABY6NQV8_9FLAO|nr:esterase-like activity of phytase family protein [Salinimicrobium tongyeongense]UZH55287.1 esterase-like activity of phytase family protein [Salinimicrobium tongyeongense]
MKKAFLLVFTAAAFLSCKSSRTGSTSNVQVRFLDDYNIANELSVKGTEVGGLSGIDYQEGNFYMVSDQPSAPRIYIANLSLSEEKIDTIVFSDVILIDKEHVSLKGQHLDLESILFEAEEGNFVLSSEGNIKKKKDPMLFRVSKKGDYIDSFAVPENLLAESVKKPRNNGTLEGLATSYDQKGIWAAMELPLVTDGPKPKLYATKSPVRITYFDKKTGEPVKQFPYRLEGIAKIPWLYFAVNGVTDLLEYAPDKFLILERGFAAGHGQKGNTVRIFDVDASLATNTLDINNLRVSFNNPAKKTLLYDFKWAKKFLSQEIIDNIEGITFGPTLPNGNQSLILISDNNFNSMGPQLNQVILMEFVPKK